MNNKKENINQKKSVKSINPVQSAILPSSQTKPGYKLTKLGWIPEEWQFLEFEQFVERSKEKYDPKSSNVNYPCIELEHIEQGIGQIIGYVESQGQKSIKNKFSAGEVLFGKLRPYLKKFWKATFDGVCSSEIWVLKGFEKKCSNEFLFYLIQIHRFIEVSNMTSGTKMPRADWQYLNKYPFPLPPMPEQQKIAQILSSWDKAITKTEQLIAKKEERKKGLMQQLLTGKRRFREFNEDWQTVRIEDIADVKGGKRLPRGRNLLDQETPYPYLRVADMYNGGVKLENIKYVPEDVYPTISRYRIFKDELFITVAGTLGIVGKIPEILDGANLTENADKLTNIKCNTTFLLYVLLSPLIQKNIEADRTSNAQPKLALTRIRNFKLRLPGNSEQQKISTTLSSADQEIEKLQKQLGKLKEQKKGLMQKLLTGEVRVLNMIEMD